MQLIRVNLEYRGSGVHIKRGEYRADDARLRGMAAYLLSQGHARVIGEVADETPPDAPDATETTPTSPPPPTPKRPPAKRKRTR